MSRYFAMQTWVGSHDDEPEYNGQQCGNRAASSHMIGNKANLEAYKDAPEKSTKAPAKSIKEQIIPQVSSLDKLDTQELALHKAFDKGEVSEEDYLQCLNALEIKKARAWKSYCKHAGIVEDVYTDTEEENAVSEGGFNVQKQHSEMNKGGMSTALFISLVFVATIALLIIAN